MTHHDLVRVQKDCGDVLVTFNLGRTHAAAQGVEVLDESAYDRGGAPKPTVRTRKRTGRPAKTKVSVAEAAAKKATAKKAAPRKRATKRAAAKKTSAATKAPAKAAESADQSDTAPSKE